MEEIESSINRYLSVMDSADRQQPDVAQARTKRLQDKFDVLKAQMEKLQSVSVELEQWAVTFLEHSVHGLAGNLFM